MSKEATPPWGLLAMGVSMLSLFLSVIALARSGSSAPRPAPPPPAVATTPIPTATSTPVPEPAPLPVPAIAPVAPPPRPSWESPTAKLAAYRVIVDSLGREVVAIAAAYPPVLPEHASSVAVRWSWPSYRGPDAVAEQLDGVAARPDAAPAIADIDDAARRFLGHLAAWLPRWSAQHRYFDRGDFLDDDLAAGRAADADLRASLVTAVELWRTFRAAVDAGWKAEVDALAARAPDSDRAVVDRAWEACRAAAELGLDGAPPDRAAAGAASVACRDGTDALRARRLEHYAVQSLLHHFDGISASLADVRRGKPVHKGNLHVYLSGSAPLVASVRSDATEVQAEAAVP